ncbi:type II CAAX endopeptidase family protein [Apirhabdus apintestini]|uniref:CPBP family intramembrane glutamic endopeptidase n=1 Tax=Erwinia sp. HR93 TaxID=3094840 RepID=UPI002ADEC8C7|nr:type II CAAX endopeptidase family protein [Erwinia sp. HR93]MEA1063239.1 type II CAAX endopeptidase family protein [Erwinia sp. HR93]WPM85018.1 type II CAAX endopeptidase family protein [Enterobacteriaceae bacterium CA-0114]
MTLLDRVMHALFCFMAWSLWYLLSLLFFLFPAAGSLYHAGMGTTVVEFLFWLPFSLLAWRYYQSLYGLMPAGKLHQPALWYGALALIALTAIYVYFSKGETQWVASLKSYSLWAWWLFVVIGCFIAPVTEEIIFRGFLYNMGVGFGRYGEYAAMLLSSLLFSLMHVQYREPATFLWLFIFSMILCQIRRYSGGLITPVLLHALSNIVTFTVLILFYR